MFGSPLNGHHRLRYSVRGPEWAFLIPSGNFEALEDVMRRCATFWNGAGSLIVPVDAKGRMPKWLDTLLAVRGVDQGWLHPSLPESVAESASESLGHVAPLRDTFDAHETHPLRLLSSDEEWPSVHVPTPHSVTMRRLSLALWGHISTEDMPHYCAASSVAHVERGTPSWHAIVSGQVDGPTTSPLRLVQRDMPAYANLPLDPPYLFVFPERPSFSSLVLFWNFRARMEAETPGAPVLGVPRQALRDNRLSGLRDWLPRRPGHRFSPDCFVYASDAVAGQVEEALAKVPIVPDTSERFRFEIGANVEPNQPATFSPRNLSLWGNFQRGLFNTELVAITDNKLALKLEAPQEYKVRDLSYARLTLHNLPAPMPLTPTSAKRIITNATVADGLMITTNATGEWNFDLTIPSPEQALHDWAADHGYACEPTQDGLDAEAILRRVKDIPSLDVLADRARLELLQHLAPPSSKKLAQGIAAELSKRGEHVDTERIGEQLAGMSLFLELRARSAAELASLMPQGVNKREVLAMLPQLIDSGFVRRARQARCPECRYRMQLDLYEQDELVRCHACRASFTLPVLDADGKEPDTMFRLDGLMARAFDQDVLPVLLALRAFARQRDPQRGFSAAPGLVFTPAGAGRKKDVDLLVSFGNVVYCCEVKKTAKGLPKEQFEQLLDLCDRLQARPAIAATDGNFPAKMAATVRDLDGLVFQGAGLFA